MQRDGASDVLDIHKKHHPQKISESQILFNIVILTSPQVFSTQNVSNNSELLT